MLRSMSELPDRLLVARARLNDGDYAGALEALGDPVGDDSLAEGARRLQGCLCLVVGRTPEGLAILERSRTSGVRPSFPSVRYRKGPAPDDVQRVAVGLLECLALGITAEEIVGVADAFDASATLRSMRMLARALAASGRDEESRQVAQAARRWARR